MMSAPVKFLRLPPAKQWLLLVIWLKLGRTHRKLLNSGLAHFTNGLTLHRTATAAQPIPAEQLRQAAELGRLVAIAARYTPWQSSCLIQVLVLQRLLQQRQIPGTFSLGVRREHADTGRKLGAHAWLLCGDSIVNGASPGRAYTTISTFSWGTQACR